MASSGVMSPLRDWIAVGVEAAGRQPVETAEAATELIELITTSSRLAAELKLI